MVEQICVKYTYRTGFVECRRDYRTNWVKKRVLGRPIKAEVFGFVSPDDLRGIRLALCPHEGKLVRYDDKGNPV